MPKDKKINDWVEGDVFGLDFPVSPKAFLAAQGAEFLTQAMHKSGALSHDNKVVSIDNTKEVVAGGMGQKLIIEVSYANNKEGLHNRLFAKFEIDEQSPIHHIYAGVMNSEVHFALLSRDENFPLNVPKCYYADVNEHNNKGLLITECIAYGQHGITTEMEKAKDFNIANVHEYYLAIANELGKLAAYDYSGGIDKSLAQKLRPKVGAPIMASLSHQELTKKAEDLVHFIKRSPQIFTPDVWQPSMAESLIYWLPRAVHNYQTLQTYLTSKNTLNTISHWNANLDNAWFWRDDSGKLNVGLLDWGNVGRINLAGVFLNMIICIETKTLEAHENAIIEALLSSYEQDAGINVSRDDFSDSLDVSMVAGLDLVLSLPDQLEGALPEYQELTDKFDPRLIDDFLGRSLTRMLLCYLSLWKRRDVGRTLKRILSDAA